MSDGTQTIGAKYGTLERGTKYYFEDKSGVLYCVTMLAKSDGTLVADPSSIRALTASDVVTANMVGFRSSDSTYQPLRLDKATNTIQTIDYEHHEIHAGSHFFVVGYQVLTLNQVLDFTWLMPNSAKWTHLVWKIETESQTLWQVYEGATATNALANTITPLNNNRNSATVSGTTMKYEIQANLTAANNDTNISGATLIESGISGTGKTAGDSDRGHELILKQNTLYCLRATATVAGFINFSMHWYEHTDIA